jgi:hypothetical protein
VAVVVKAQSVETLHNSEQTMVHRVQVVQAQQIQLLVHLSPMQAVVAAAVIAVALLLVQVELVVVVLDLKLVQELLEHQTQVVVVAVVATMVHHHSQVVTVVQV